MRSKFEKSQLELLRAAALPYNPYFEKEVIEIRRKYGIPKEPENTPYEFTDPSIQDLGEIGVVTEHVLKGNIKITLPERDESGNRKGHIERTVLNLLARYQLPSVVYETILQYIFRGDKSLFFDYMEYFGFGATIGTSRSRADVLGESLAEEEPQIEFTVSVNRWCTKDLWIKLWDSVSKEVERMRKRYGEVSKKRPTITSSLRKQIERWWEWYRFVEIEGYSIQKAIEKWQLLHPEQVSPKDIDESTVSKAVAKFREIITPIPIDE